MKLLESDKHNMKTDCQLLISFPRIFLKNHLCEILNFSIMQVSYLSTIYHQYRINLRLLLKYLFLIELSNYII
jgi:hypothetical protein